MTITLEVDEIRVVVEDGVPRLEIYDFSHSDGEWMFQGADEDAADRLRTLLAFIEQHAKKAD